VSEKATVVQHYAYSAFGKILKISDGSGNDISANPTVEPYFTYTGREWDAESQLYHYRARAYDPSIGRFLQQDPDPGKLKLPSTHINKYMYVVNNPLNLTDPTGHGFFKSIGNSLKSVFSLKNIVKTLVVTAVIGTAIFSGGGSLVLYGALIGAGTGAGYAALTGQDIGEYAFKGAVAGAIVGASASLLSSGGGLMSGGKLSSSFWFATGQAAATSELQSGNFLDNFIYNGSLSYGAAATSQYAVDNWWSPADVEFFNYNDMTATYGLYSLGNEFNNRYQWW